MSRARSAAAALAAVTAGAAALVVTFVPAQAAAPQGATAPAVALTPVSTSTGTRTLIVDPTTDLAVSNATIKVQGKGFSTDHGLYVAVCADGSGAPADLKSCVGGSIPGANTTTAWAHITADGQGQGGVKAAWGPDGSFSVTLALGSVADGNVNCVTGKCSLYTTSDDPSIRDGDNAVRLAFASPPSSSSVPSTPGTAIPQNISSPTIVAGGTQNVIFSGFRAGEQVNLTLFSAPISLSPVTADGTGVARVEFIVPADLVAGTHRLEAIGQQSGTVGVASFQVAAPPVASSPSPTTPSPSPSSSASSSVPTSSSVSSSSSAPASSATSRIAVTPSGGDSGNSLWWLWLIVGIVVVAGIVTAIVVYRRKQQEQREQDEKEIADAAAREQQAAAGGAGGSGGYDAPTVFLPPVQPSGPPPGADPYGLLSGRDHPDNPTLYSGQDPAAPTRWIDPQGQQGPGPYGQPLGYGGPSQGFAPPPQYGAPDGFGTPPEGSGGLSGPPTEALPPTPLGSPGGGGADGPGTQAWSPDFDDTDTGSSTDTGSAAGPGNDDGDGGAGDRGNDRH